ncbi:cation:proton antiporter [Dehalogenimonas etheniformans]|uniref:Cation:proton antiporter n=1 Tax=Dehalogenimonas etheniformans TaxID=1536648 RepID=A0A2P5P9Q0_9CHLR|nr:cation:proton antiporter [Dehalogenimonas etheniformans]PPD59029.1 cation:proton antiporter [Dehalogenimonas etheniformans]QNT76205.1 cation:proton antiporter [Dehalogenimonas etheniformans]
METEALVFKLILTFGLVLLAARIGGEVAERFFKQPAVIGELVAGIMVSPFLLGGLLNDPAILNFATINGYLADGGLEVEGFNPLQIVSEIAVIALLFVAGLETDVRAFVKNAFTGALVAVGGVTLPFVLGFFAAKYFFPDIGTIGWLFTGAVLTATSIGITVRILMDMGKLGTREGTIILVAAVIDDILGLVILSIVVSMAKTGELSLGSALVTGAIGFGVWLAILFIGYFGHRYISKFLLTPFKESGLMPITALIIGIIIAYAVTLVGLHPVVGAYVAGLMFASTGEREQIIAQTRPIMLFLAPFFFAYLGMQVDLKEIAAVIIPAAVIIILAVVGKIVGCYLPARYIGKCDTRGALVVGMGMVPRGEVGLIVAGAGLLVGAISRDIFGVAVAVSLVTTLIGPSLIKPFFKKPTTAKPPTIVPSGR